MTFEGFTSRTQAGQLLADRVAECNFERPVVLALPRGGVPVALEIAQRLKAPLDLLLVRKIGVPWQTELAAAAIVDGQRHDVVFNDEVMLATGLRKNDLANSVKKELSEIGRRRKIYLKDRQPVSVEGCTAIVVDDGIATGTTVKAALKALRRRKPKKLVLAVPLAPHEAIAELGDHVDQIICLQQPEPFHAIGIHYRDFHQVSDEEVIEMLARANNPAEAGC